jgi:hypothetical protein
VIHNFTKCSVFWDTTPCNPLKANRRFGGKFRLHLQVRRTRQARNNHEVSSKQTNHGNVISVFWGDYNRFKLRRRDNCDYAMTVSTCSENSRWKTIEKYLNDESYNSFDDKNVRSRTRLGKEEEVLRQQQTAWPLVSKQTISTERPPLVGEVSASFCG